jgi:hypothetical protein
MPELITLDEAKAHLRVTTIQDDGDIQLKLLAATQVVIDYLTRRDTDWNAEMDAWTAETVPPSVRAAIFVQLGELYRKRGDDPDTEPRPASGGAFLSPTVTALLMRYRDPGVA